MEIDVNSIKRDISTTIKSIVNSYTITTSVDT